MYEEDEAAEVEEGEKEAQGGEEEAQAEEWLELRRPPKLQARYH